MKYYSEDKKKEREKEREDKREVLNFTFILRDTNSIKAMKFDRYVYLQQLVILLFRAIYQPICFVFDSSLRSNGVPRNNFTFAGQISVFSTFPRCCSVHRTDDTARPRYTACLRPIRNCVNFVSPHLENYISKLARCAQNPETNTRSVRRSPFYDWLELTNQAGGKIRWTRCTTVHEMEERWNVGQKGKEEGIQVGGGRIETTKATRIFLLSGGKHGNYLLYDGMGGQSVRPFIKLNERIQRWTRRAVSVVRHWKKAKRRRTRRWKWGDERRRKASPRPWTKGGTTICNYVSFYPIPS